MKLLFALIYLVVFISQVNAQVYYYPVDRDQPHAINSDRIRTYWQIRDEWDQRNKTENYLDKKERMLAQAERRYNLMKRERELRSKGILPPHHPDAGKFFFEGKKYNSFDDFKLSSDYQKWLYDKYERQYKREQKELEKERQRKEYNAFLQMWHKMGPIGRERYSRLPEDEKKLRIKEFVDPEFRAKRLKEKVEFQLY